MHRILPYAFLAAVVCAAPVRPAFADAAPYTDWSFDMGKASKAGDLDRIAELTRAQPAFGRVWFFGLVFDLVTVGVPDGEKQRLLPQLERIAEVMGALDPPDPRPLIYMDRARSGVLEGFARQARELQQNLIAAVRGGTFISAQLAPAEHPEVADAVFYGLFFRAELAAARMGGKREQKVLLATARRMAEGSALGLGDLGPWRAMSAWYGREGGVPLEGEAMIEEWVGAGLNSLVADDLPGAKKHFSTAMSAALGARGASLYTAIIMNGAANVEIRLGNHTAGRTLRVRVLQAVRPLGKPGLVALAASQMMEAHLSDKTLHDMIPYSRELRELGPGFYGVARYLQVMEQASEALREGAKEETAAGKIPNALRLLDESEQLVTVLKQRDMVALVTPAANVERVRLQRERVSAELRRVWARLAARQGRYEDARAGFAEAVLIFETVLGDTIEAARTDLEAAEAFLAGGVFEEALAHTQAVQNRLGLGSPALRARNFLLQGWIRLRQGDFRKAFSNANFALAVLRRDGLSDTELPLRAELHRLAGVTLHAAGFGKEARERLAFGEGVAPTQETPLLRAMAHAEAGDTDGALAALDALGKGATAIPQEGAPPPRWRADDEPRIASVYRGYALARAGRYPEAIEALRDVPTMTLPHLRAYHIAGLTCLAYAHLRRNDVERARKILAPARALVLEHVDAGLAWRVHALEGEIAARRGAWLDAAASWRQAVDRYVETLGEHPGLGFTLDIEHPALPATIDESARALPHALVKAAAKDKKTAATQHRAALSYALWSRQQGLAPRAGLVLAPRVPAGMQPLRVAIAVATAQRIVLQDPAVDGAERVAATQAMIAAYSALRDGMRDLRVAEPAWTSYVWPAPSSLEAFVARDEARLYFHFDDNEGHLWVLLPDTEPVHYGLAGRAALAKTLEPALAALLTAPPEWPAETRRPTDPNAGAWKTLAAPLPAVLPFVRDKKMMAALSDKPLRVFQDGPLLRFPIGALVLEPPPRKEIGKPPVFVASKWSIRNGLLPELAPAARQGEPRKRYAFVGPIGGGQGCPDSPSPLVTGFDLCAGADAGVEGQAVTGAWGAAADQFTNLALEGATADATADALLDHAFVHIGAPFDSATGDVVLSPAAGEPTLSRLTPDNVGLRPASASLVILSRLSAPLLAEATGAGLRRFEAAARFAGIPDLLVLGFRRADSGDMEVAGELAARVARGATPEAALAEWQRGRMATAVDPAAGGASLHHPYYWSRWQAFTR